MATMQSPSRTLAPGHAVRAATDGPSWSELLTDLIDLLLVWRERARQRRQLQALSDHMLRDIGLTRGDVYAEASKPFWRP